MSDNKIDPIINAMLNPCFREVPEVDDAPHPMERFIEASRLAGAIGWDGVEKLAEATQGLNERADTILRAPRKQPCEIQRASSPDSLDDAHALNKRFGGIHAGEKASRIEKSANGKWAFEFSSDNRLIRGYEIEAEK